MEKTNDQFAEWKCDVTLQTLRLLREYYEQPHVHKLDPLDEMDLFLENHELPKHTKDETDSLINPLTINGIEFTVNPFEKKKTKQNKTTGPNSFTAEAYQTFKETPIHISLPENRREEFPTLP